MRQKSLKRDLGSRPLTYQCNIQLFPRERVFYGSVKFMVEIKGRKFTVILREEPEGGYSAQCVELPGAISQGENRKEALANIKEAIEGYLEAFPEEFDQLKRKRELVEITI